jgi:aminoglycoside/choline kinase family phosphotransferase
MHEPIVQLFRAHFGSDPTAVEALAGDGSARTYLRLKGMEGRTVVGGYGPEPEENRAFLAFGRAFREAGLPVPEILAADPAAGVWLEEDLGDTTLFDALRSARDRAGPTGKREGVTGDAAAGRNDPQALPPDVRDVYRRVVDWLPRFQVEGHRVADYRLAYPHRAFDRQSILWDLNYFKYHFLKLAHVPFHEARLERDFRKLTAFLVRAPADHFLYRDFQSRNVMLRDGEPWFIDFQGGRRGAPQYDLASLLYDAKADLPPAFREELVERYLEARERLEPVDRSAFLELFPGFVLVRLMQAMGAYGYRGFYEGKPRFLDSVPHAARNLAAILGGGLPLETPELEAVLARIAERWSGEGGGAGRPAGLTVHVISFSYRRGYPSDPGGHGGGFVFDCRALPNPGREEAFMDLTGLDRAVREYLEAEPACRAFFEHAAGLVAEQVVSYRDRGFTDLVVAFGCTGGQHRSVYLAERLRGALGERFPEVTVDVTHRERPFWPNGGAAGA